MKKELVIIYDTPSEFHTSLIERQNLRYYLKYFSRIHVVYWSKDSLSKPFLVDNGEFIFYPYCIPYDSGYVRGLKYMVWIGKTLWKICKKNSQNTKLILMPVIPIWPGIPSLIVGKLRRKKVVLRLEHPKIEGLKIEDETLGPPKIFTIIKVLILKIVYFLTIPLYDFIVGISNYVLKEARYVKTKKSIRIPMFIDTVRFKPREVKKDKTQLLILSVGQIKKRKGFGEIIEALQLLKKETDIAFKLLIVGRVTNPSDEGFLQEFKDLAKGLNIEFRLNVKHHDELAKIYNEADILVSASYIEGLGMVIMEAMASELPVIASGDSGPKDLVEEGKTGFLVPIKNYIALKEKIKILLEDQNLRKSMGKAGREKIKELMRLIDKRREELWKDQGVIDNK